MKYDKFLRILLNEEDKPINWEEILEDYVDAIKTPKSENIFDLTKKIMYTDWKFNFLFGTETYYGALHILKIEYDAEIAEMIMLAGYDLIQPLEERDKYLKQIYLVETEAKTLIVLLNQYDLEYKLLCPGDSNVMRKRSDYEKEYAMIMKFMHQWTQPDQITISQYCAMVNLYIDACRTTI